MASRRWLGGLYYRNSLHLAVMISGSMKKGRLLSTVGRKANGDGDHGYDGHWRTSSDSISLPLEVNCSIPYLSSRQQANPLPLHLALLVFWTWRYYL